MSFYFANMKSMKYILFLVVSFTSSFCRGESVDLSEYITPQAFNGQVRAVYGYIVLNKELIEDTVSIIEYNNGLITDDFYELLTPAGMKEFNESKKMVQRSSSRRAFTLEKDVIIVAGYNENEQYKYGYSIPRTVELDKLYKDKSVGTIVAPLPTFNRNIKISDMFKLTVREGKNCLLHTRIEEEDNKNSQRKDRNDYLYCKPYGFVLHTIYEKDGRVVDYMKLRKMEEL